MTNSIGMKLVYIPAGEFMMGSPASESGRDDDEGPRHKVSISKGFWLGQTEVTVGQYLDYLNAGGDSSGVDFSDSDCPVKRSGSRYVLSGNKFGKSASQPMVEVSWHGAMKFCDWLSRKEGRDYSLPTEAQWEYACRAGTTTVYNWGDSWLKGVCNAENDVGSSEDSNVEIFRKRGLPVDSTMPVGSFKPNDWKLYDMHGNVWEWCRDWYDSDFYRKGDKTDPENTARSAFRVCRGGSWVNNPGDCRCANRNRVEPDNSYDDLGFRVLLFSSGMD